MVVSPARHASVCTDLRASKLQAMYIASSREAKRLDSISQSPLFSTLSETGQVRAHHDSHAWGALWRVLGPGLSGCVRWQPCSAAVCGLAGAQRFTLGWGAVEMGAVSAVPFLLCQRCLLGQSCGHDGQPAPLDFATCASPDAAALAARHARQAVVCRAW